jgi:hypothetical protein
VANATLGLSKMLTLTSRSPYTQPPPAALPTATTISPEADELTSSRSPLPTYARQVTRMNAMFWPSRGALGSGADMRRAIEDGSADTLRATALPT